MTCRFNLFVSIFHFDYYYHYYTCLSDNMELSFQRLELINQFKNLFYLFSDKIDIFPNILIVTLFCPPREAEIVHVRGMWFSDSWPIYFTSGPGSRVACIVFKMCWLQPILGWKLHVLCPGRQNILSERLCQVRVKDWPPSFYSWPSSFFSILVLLVIEENWWDRY